MSPVADPVTLQHTNYVKLINIFIKMTLGVVDVYGLSEFWFWTQDSQDSFLFCLAFSEEL